MSVKRLRKQISDLNPKSMMTLVAAVGIQMVTMFLLARELGAAEFGYYAVYTSIIAILVELIGFGAGDLYIKNVVADSSKSGYISGHATYISILFPLVFIAPVFFLISETTNMIWAYATVFFVYTDIVAARSVLFLEQFFIAHQAPATANRLRAIFNGSRLVGILAFGVLLSGPATLANWLPVQASIGAFVALLFAVHYFRAYGYPQGSLKMRLLLDGLPLGASQVLRISQQNLDRVLLLTVVSANTIGVYAIASRLAFASLAPTLSLLRMKTPSFHLAAPKGWQAAIDNAVDVSKKTSAVTAFTTIILIPSLLVCEKLLGPEFSGLFMLGIFIAPSLFLLTLNYVLGDVIFSLGLNYYRLFMNVFGVCAYVLLILILGYTAGLTGVLIAINLSMLLNVFLAVFVVFFYIRKNHGDPRG